MVMRLDKGLHEEDSDDDENDPILILQLISLQVKYNTDLPYVRKYLLFHRARYEPYINTPFWNTLSLPTRNFISEVYVGKKDIQFTPCERSTTDYPVTLISPSLDPHIDELFESSLSDNLSSRVVDHLSPLGNVVSYDNTSLIFVSDSDDDLMDSDDESSFLSFDEETFDYYEAEWVELISRPVCFPLTSIHIRFPSFGLDITEISSRLLFIPSPLPLLPPSFLDLRVAYGQRMFWKIFVHSSSLGAFLFVPPLLTADFKFYDRIFSLQPSIYDQITRFACLFEIFAGLLF
ncbi:unnamed protein product [Rhizophagus irregularis]|nr:unnamed protein product [Rhizophagus irregularis]